MKGEIIFSFKPPTQVEGDLKTREWYNECAKRVADYANKRRRERDEWIATKSPLLPSPPR